MAFGSWFPILQRFLGSGHLLPTRFLDSYVPGVLYIVVSIEYVSAMVNVRASIACGRRLAPRAVCGRGVPTHRVVVCALPEPVHGVQGVCWKGRLRDD